MSGALCSEQKDALWSPCSNNDVGGGGAGVRARRGSGGGGGEAVNLSFDILCCAIRSEYLQVTWQQRAASRVFVRTGRGRGRSMPETTTTCYLLWLTSIPKLGWRKHDSCRQRGCLTLTISFDLGARRSNFRDVGQEKKNERGPRVV